MTVTRICQTDYGHFVEMQERIAELEAENAKLQAVVDAARADLNRIATMPWCKDTHIDTKWACVPDHVWVDWIHGTHEQLHEALAALGKKS